MDTLLEMIATRGLSRHVGKAAAEMTVGQTEFCCYVAKWVARLRMFPQEAFGAGGEILIGKIHWGLLGKASIAIVEHLQGLPKQTALVNGVVGDGFVELQKLCEQGRFRADQSYARLPLQQGTGRQVLGGFAVHIQTAFQAAGFGQEMLV